MEEYLLRKLCVLAAIQLVARELDAITLPRDQFKEIFGFKSFPRSVIQRIESVLAEYFCHRERRYYQGRHGELGFDGFEVGARTQPEDEVFTKVAEIELVQNLEELKELYCAPYSEVLERNLLMAMSQKSPWRRKNE